MQNTQAAPSVNSESKFLADSVYNKGNQNLISSLSSTHKRALGVDSAQFDSLTPSPNVGDSNNSDNNSILDLVIPSTNLVSNFDDSDNKSLIAIIGQVLALQAKSSSEYWSNLWQQATTSMNQAVALAPMIYTQVTMSYQNQSQQTQNESDSAFAQGWVNVGMAGMSIGMGVMAGINAAKEEAPNPTSKFENQLKPNDDVELRTSDDERALQEEITTQSSPIKEDASPSVLDKASRSMNQGRFMKGFGKVFEALQKAQAGIQVVGNIGGAANNFIDSHFKGKNAAVQLQIGQNEATSKELEQFAQYYNQSFQRNEDLRGGSQNIIDTSMQILKSIADTLTQTTQSMFRG